MEISGEIPENAVLIEAIYNTNNTLVSASMHSAESLTVRNVVPEQYIKYMLWDSIISIGPIAEGIVIDQAAE